MYQIDFVHILPAAYITSPLLLSGWKIIFHALRMEESYGPDFIFV
jgi:hypothetical protein